jgi:P2-related tail formation protein
MRTREEVLFRDAQLTDGLPEILAQEPWETILAQVFAQEMQRYLLAIETHLILSWIDRLPEEMLDILAMDMLLWQYRETDVMEQKREAVKSAWMFWSKAGTVFASRKIAEIFFGNAELEEWFNYGGEPNFFRVIVPDQSPTWDRILKFLEISEYFKRLSQELEGVRIVFRNEVGPVYIGNARIEHHVEPHDVSPDLVLVYSGLQRTDHIVEPHPVDAGAEDETPALQRVFDARNGKLFWDQYGPGTPFSGGMDQSNFFGEVQEGLQLRNGNFCENGWGQIFETARMEIDFSLESGLGVPGPIFFLLCNSNLYFAVKIEFPGFDIDGKLTYFDHQGDLTQKTIPANRTVLENGHSPYRARLEMKRGWCSLFFGGFRLLADCLALQGFEDILNQLGAASVIQEGPNMNRGRSYIATKNQTIYIQKIIAQRD